MISENKLYTLLKWLHIVNHDPLSDKKYGFRFVRSAADIRTAADILTAITVVRAVALDITIFTLL